MMSPKKPPATAATPAPLFTLNGVDDIAQELRDSTDRILRAEADFNDLARKVWSAEKVDLPAIAEQRTALREKRYAATEVEKPELDNQLDALDAEEDRLRRFLVREQPGLPAGVAAAENRRQAHRELRNRFASTVGVAGQELIASFAPEIRVAIEALATWYQAIEAARLTYSPIANQWLQATTVPDLTTPSIAYGSKPAGGWSFSGPGLLTQTPADAKATAMTELFAPLQQSYQDAGNFDANFAAVHQEVARTWRTPAQLQKDAELRERNAKAQSERDEEAAKHQEWLAAQPKWTPSRHRPSGTPAPLPAADLYGAAATPGFLGERA